MNTGNTIQAQYTTDKNLSTRISIHDKYSVNKQGFGPWIVSHYPITTGARVLELGCGTGSMWTGHGGLITACGELVLSDLSAGMLETAKENVSGPNVRHMVIDIQDIPFPADSFDLVIANMMLYHVPDLDRALREVRRVLKPGGTFVCATYGDHGILEYLADIFGPYGVSDDLNRAFTLQNGHAILEPWFAEVDRLFYPDALAVTDLEDMADYILSLSAMSALAELPRRELLGILAQHTDNGVLTVPKEYGLFLAR